MIEKNKNTIYYLLYTITFAFIITAIFSWFFLNNKSFLWRDDGIYQHFNALVYYRTYLITIIKKLFATGVFEIPLWDFSLGYGADILTTLNYYVIGDPINLLVVLVPSRFMELAYSALVLLRLYLAGVTFSLYCRRMKRGYFAVLIGTFVYIFCAYGLFAAVRHPFFIGPMIMFPCLLIGIENIFARKGPKLFIIMVFVAAVSNFYFFYMMSILILIYACIRFFTLHQRPWLITFFKTVLRFIGYYVTGVLMASTLFLPVVIEMLCSGRAHLKYAIDMFYSADYYVDFFTRFLTVRSIGNWTYMGYAAIAVISILGLIMTKHKYKEIKIALLILTMFIYIPFAGTALNGFSYNANRWIWGYSFFIAFIVVSTMEEILTLSRKKMVLLTVITSIYSSICLIIGNMGNESNIKQISLLLVFLVILIVFTCWRERHGAVPTQVLFTMKGIMLFIVLINVIMNAYDLYSPNKKNYIDQFCDAGTGLSILEDGAAKAVLGTTDTDFYRYEDNPNQQEIVYNTALQTGLKSTSFYFSLANSHIYDYFKELQTNYSNDFQYIGLDGRTYPGTLAASRYFVIAKGNEAYLPFGYTKTSNTAKKNGIIYQAYQNDYALPLGYTYEKYIDRAIYDGLSPLHKQAALLQGIVLDAQSQPFEPAQLEFTSQNIDYKLRLGKGVKLKDNKIITNHKNSFIELTFDGLDNSETYCTIQGLTYSDPNQLKTKKQSVYQYIKQKNNLKRYKKLTILTFLSKSVSKEVLVHCPGSIYNIGRTDYKVNLGYDKNKRTKIKIVFENKGTYAFDKIEVACQPMDRYASAVLALQEDTLKNVKIYANTVVGSINLDQDKILCLSIPYSKGWSAYVNGAKKELLQANTMYMGMPLKAGEYQIQLKYMTPGLKAGIALSLIGAVSFILICCYDKKFYY